MVLYGNSTHVQKAAGMIYKYVFANLNEPAKIGVEGSEYGRTLIQLQYR